MFALLHMGLGFALFGLTVWGGGRRGWAGRLGWWFGFPGHRLCSVSSGGGLCVGLWGEDGSGLGLFGLCAVRPPVDRPPLRVRLSFTFAPPLR